MTMHHLNTTDKLRTFDVRRIIIELIAAVIFSVLLVFLISESNSQKLHLRGIAFSASTIIILCEGIFIFDAIISKKYPWYKAMKKRIISLFVFSFFWFSLMAISGRFIAKEIFELEPAPNAATLNTAMAIYIMFTVIYVISLIGLNYHNTLKDFILENERLKRQKMELDYFSLQDQLNPHFLFNNLSTLMALIPEDSAKALRFAGDFTDVYRYVLMSSRHRLVTIEDEVQFINSYIALHKERLGDGSLFTNFDIEEREMERKIPTLSLQFLIENAIKHNIASKHEALTININVKDNMLVVTNNLQPKLSTYSTNTGLKNLERRIRFLSSNQKLVVENNGRIFTVKVPIIHSRDH